MKATIRGIRSAFLFALVLSALFQSWEISLVITLSLLVHELGHILMIQRMGIPWEFGFSYLGAWTRTSLRTRQALGNFANSLIHLAGPLFSFLLSVSAIVIYMVSDPESRNFFWVRLANFSVLLGLTNLLPIGAATDGGKFLQRLVVSTGRQGRSRLILLLLQLFVVLSEHVREINNARAISIGIFGLWFLLGMFRNLRDPVAVEPGPEATMSERQAGALFSFLIMLILYSYVVTVLTPFWLSEADVLHMLTNFESTILAFIRLPAGLKWTALLVILTVPAGWLIRRMRRRNHV